VIGSASSDIGGDWAWAVYAPSTGSIYAVPASSSAVLRIIPSAGTASEIGTLGTGPAKWKHAVYVPSTQAIYGVPYFASTIVKIDTANSDTVSTFGSLGTAQHKWEFGVVAPSNHVYLIPNQVGKVGKVNTETDQVTQFGSCPDNYRVGILAKTGMIYAIGGRMGGVQSSILKIDPQSDTTTTFGAIGVGHYLFLSMVATPAGPLYGIPAQSTKVLKIDPSDDSYVLFGFGTGGAGNYGSGVYSPFTGYIYGEHLRRSGSLGAPF
jgi:hypothetical protein